MGKYDSKLLGSEEIAQSTLAFHFEKPDGFESRANLSTFSCRRIFQA